MKINIITDTHLLFVLTLLYNIIMNTVLNQPVEESFFADEKKIGPIVCSKGEFYSNGNLILLQEKDLKLPVRLVQNVNKGSFGHVAAVMGEKPGAGIIAATAAFAFGAGLVTLICKARPVCCPYELMDSPTPPAATTALALGMGLGTPTQELLSWTGTHTDIPCVLDADILKYKKIEDLILSLKNIVLTPHPREFATLLDLCNIGKFDVAYVVENRFELVRRFCKKYPHAVLVLKGANVLIAQGEKVYVNTFGTACLAKGGSGDVLSGLTAALLAQKYSPLDAAISASLAHALASQKVKCSYGMTPFELIEKVKLL